MSKELYVSSTPHETKLAIVEDEQLVEIYFERENEYSLAGSIYKGRVTRVLPGMQSAFVDIGLERDAFLYVTDFMEDQEEQDEDFAPSRGQANGRERERGGRREQREEHYRERPAVETPSERDATPPEFSLEGGFGSEEQGEAFPQATSPEESEMAGGREADQGARRWRGRRGRRRGRGGIAEKKSEAREDSPTQNEEHATGVPASWSMEASDPSPSGIGLADEPEQAASEEHTHEEHAQKPSGFRSSPPAGRDEPVILPGESLSKYRRGSSPEPSTARGSAVATTLDRQSAPSGGRSITPSTEVKDINFSGVSDWNTLPGESLSGRRRGQGSQTASPALEAEVTSGVRGANAVPIGRQRREPRSRQRESSIPAPARVVEEPSTLIRVAEEPHKENSLRDADAEEELRFEEVEKGAGWLAKPPSSEDSSPPSAVPVSRVPEQSVDTPAAAAPKPGFFAALFGRKSASRTEERHDAANRKPDQSVHSAGSEAPGGPSAQMDEQDGAVSATQQGQQGMQTPEQNKHSYEFSPGTGLVEEEVIEDEEFDFHNPHEAFEDSDFEDYEEETLKHRPDDVAAGHEVAEAVRDVHVEEQATGHHEAEGLGELEQEIQEFVEQGEGGEDIEGVVPDADTEEPGPLDREAELRAPAGTAAFQQKVQRGERGGRRFGRGRRGPVRQGQSQGGVRRGGQRSPTISDLLKEGQEILVQIAKEPIAKKGARITSHIALPGRFLVYMPTVHHVGVSRKIASDEERQRLKRILLSEKGEAHGGFIVRTAAAGADEEDLRADIRFLINLWNEVRLRSEGSKAPALIYHDLNLVERILRDQVTTNFSHLWVDNEQEYERIVKFLSRFQPGLMKRVKLYTKETPLFEQFNIQEEINKALKSKVWLKSGGYIVINQTEALVAIDINTGKYVGKTARLEDTIVKTNIDAIQEIVRQIRLRDLGGIIVIDFIDMDERRNRQKVMQALEEALKADRAPSKVLQFNDFGLVAITRKRVKQSLERTLGTTCVYCTGTGMIKSPMTVCNEIYVEMRRMSKHFEHDIMLRVNPEIVKQLKASGAKWLNEMEELTKRTIIVKSDPAIHQEQFDIQ